MRVTSIIIIIMRVTIIIISFALTFFLISVCGGKRKNAFSFIFSAVEAGVSTYSGQKVCSMFYKRFKKINPTSATDETALLQVWSQSNTLVYCFTLATTIGYGHLTPTDPSE